MFGGGYLSVGVEGADRPRGGGLLPDFRLDGPPKRLKPDPPLFLGGGGPGPLLPMEGVIDWLSSWSSWSLGRRRPSSGRGGGGPCGLTPGPGGLRPRREEVPKMLLLGDFPLGLGSDCDPLKPPPSLGGIGPLGDTLSPSSGEGLESGCRSSGGGGRLWCWGGGGLLLCLPPNSPARPWLLLDRGSDSEDPNPPGAGPGDLPLGSSLGGGGPRRLGPVPKMLVFGFRPVEGLLPRSCGSSSKAAGIIICCPSLLLSGDGDLDLDRLLR